jgi:Flp pilus assembly protein TadD
MLSQILYYKTVDCGKIPSKFFPIYGEQHGLRLNELTNTGDTGLDRKARLKRERQLEKTGNIAENPDTEGSGELSPDEELIVQSDIPSSFYFVAVLILATAWTFTLYSESLNGPFIWDDITNIERNREIRLETLSFKGIKDVFFESLQPRRPIVNFSFAVNYYFHKYEVWGYRIFNVLIHLLNAIVLYFLAKNTLRTPALSGRYNEPVKISLTAALLFLVHPVAVQSVAYVVQRMTSLATLFFLLSLLCYAKARLNVTHKKLLLAGSLSAGALALGSKEIATTLPIVILLYEFYFFQDLKWELAKKYVIWLGACLFVFGLIAFVFLGDEPFNGILSGYGKRDFTLGERLLTELRVVVYYLSLLILPHPSRLNLDYDFHLSSSLIDPVSTLTSLLVLLVLTGIAIYTARRYRLLSFTILWYLINLTIESTVIPLEIIFEHRTYLPFTMIFVIFAAILHQSIHDKRWRFALIGILISIMSLWTYHRAAMWGDDIALWKDVVSKSPEKSRPHNNLGAILRDKNYIRESLPYFEKAVLLDPENSEAHKSHIDALYRLGRLHEALISSETYVRLWPDKSDGHTNLAIILQNTGRVAEAVKHYERAIELDKNAVRARIYLAQLLFNHRAEAARPIELLKEAVGLKKTDPEIRINLAQVLMATGRKNDAASELKQAIALDPDNASARKLLRQMGANLEPSISF